ncbi:MAG TPA: hypothetical protein VLB83_04530 [Candidatus Paceibacterota bacterium]|nr:hypothetical protein [Candidatus Paceibacterota bacterium]
MRTQKVDINRVLEILSRYAVLTAETVRSVRKFFHHEEGWGERLSLPCPHGRAVRMNWDNLGVYLEPIGLAVPADQADRERLDAVNAALLEAVPPKLRLDQIRRTAYCTNGVSG